MEEFSNGRDSTSSSAVVVGQPAEHFKLVECLDVRLYEAKDIPARHHGSTGERSVYCVVKLDREDVFYSSTASGSENFFFGDHFYKEVPKNFRQLSFYVFDQFSGRIARQLARLTFRKKDIVKYSGLDQWYTLKPLLNRQSDVSGKVCVEISHEQSVNNGDAVHKVKLRVLDYCDLSESSSRNADLFALVSFQQGLDISDIKKIRIRRKSSAASTNGLSLSGESAIFDLNSFGATAADADGGQMSTEESVSCDSKIQHIAAYFRVSIWNDIGLVSSFFHGEVQVPVTKESIIKNIHQPNVAWYYLKPRGGSLESENRQHRSASTPNDLGSIRLKINYAVDHILPALCYSELWTNLLDSLNTQPWRCSVVALLDVLPNSDLEASARSLVKVFLHSEKIKQLVRFLCVEELKLCQDVNTLFRSNSFASKCVCEMMKLVGQQYLVNSLKPCVDKIFNEKKNCEIDPQRTVINSIDANMQNLIVYTELALSRILDSNHRCPQMLKDIFRVIRECTSHQFPNRLDIQWLVLGSFLIHRFFAAALMTPKLYGLQKNNPNQNVARTLALISKIVQRVSSAVVVGRQLVEKESYMSVILERFTDERHKCAFVKFFDRISCTNGDQSISGESVTVLKEGCLIERLPKRNVCFNLRRLHAKPRFCCLTEGEFYWTKEKGGATLGKINLLDLTAIQSAEEEFQSKLVFQLATETTSIFLEACSTVDLGDWISALKKAGRRQRLTQQQDSDNAQIYDIVVENQLEAIHMNFLRNIETIRIWKDVANGLTPVPHNFPSSLLSDSQACLSFLESVQKVLCCAYTLEQKHREALIRHLSQYKYGSKDMPIGDDNYLLLKSRMRSFSIESSSNNNKPLTPSFDKTAISLLDEFEES